MKNKFFTLYTYCRTIEGRDFSIILDLQRVRYTRIPAFLREILFEYLHLPVADIIDLYQDGEGHILSALGFLEKDKFGFFTDNPEQYPPLNLTWKTPGILQNAIVEIESLAAYDYSDVFSQLEELNCYHFEIWLDGSARLGALENVLAQFNESRVKSFDLIIPYEAAYTREELTRFKKVCEKVNFILVYSSPEERVYTDSLVIFKTESLEELKAKSARPTEELCVNLAFYIEALYHNPFHNQKVAISKDGFIQNSMQTETAYGHIKEQRIRDVVMKEAFQESWHVSNDRVEDLKNSPLRYSIMNKTPLEKDGSGYKLKQ